MKEALCRLEVAHATGRHERRHPELVGGLDAGALLQEALHDRHVAAVGGEVEGSPPEAVSGVDLGAFLQAASVLKSDTPINDLV